MVTSTAAPAVHALVAEHPPASNDEPRAAAQKAVVRRFVEELWNRAHLDVADEIFAPGCVPHTFAYGPDAADAEDTAPPGRRGPGHIKAIVAGWRRAFPDWHITIADMLAEGDQVMLLTTGEGTHLGPLMGIAPTGKRVAFTGMRLFRFAANQVVEYWVLWDWRGLWLQLGQMPERERPSSRPVGLGLSGILRAASALTGAAAAAAWARSARPGEAGAAPQRVFDAVAPAVARADSAAATS